MGGCVGKVPVFGSNVLPEPTFNVAPVLISTPFVKRYTTPDVDPGKENVPETTGLLPVKQTTPFSGDGSDVTCVVSMEFVETVFVPETQALFVPVGLITSDWLVPGVQVTVLQQGPERLPHGLLR